jgi:TonB family protein
MQKGGEIINRIIYILFSLLLLSTASIFSQTKDDCDKLYDHSSKDGLDESWDLKSPVVLTSTDSIKSNLHYPEEAIKRRTEGTVFIKLIVDTTGFPMCARIIRGLPNGCDEEALRLSQMFRFTPAFKHKGKIRIPVILPIVFNIEDYLKRKEKNSLDSLNVIR